MNRNNRGFGIVEVIFVVVFVALIGFIGWKAWEAVTTKSQTDSGQTDTSQAPAVNKVDDLNKADGVLDKTDVDGSDASKLNSATNF